jgi:hypothetical protein
VFKVAFPELLTPLCPREAAKLWHTWEWIITWYEVDKYATSERVKENELNHLGKIGKVARRLRNSYYLHRGLPQ